jgi:hypothetical protein
MLSILRKNFYVMRTSASSRVAEMRRITRYTFIVLLPVCRCVSEAETEDDARVGGRLQVGGFGELGTCFSIGRAVEMAILLGK